jgi:type I restriction enzyme S subunit
VDLKSARSRPKPNSEPPGWREYRLGSHVTFLKNGVNSRAELHQDGPVKYLHYGDIHACEKSFLSPSSLPSVPIEKAREIDRLEDGDLVFADTSEDIEGICKSVELRDVGTTETVAGLHTIAARFDKNVLADGFKGYLQFLPPFATHLRRLAAGTKVFATNRSHIAGASISLPSVAEQRAIAAALSDADALLEGLTRLIAKKRDLKQAAMQQLLTGQGRLPGFHGEWAVKRLADHVAFLRNGVNSRAELRPEGRVKNLHYGEVHSSMAAFLAPQTLPSLPVTKAARLDRLRDGDVIFADTSEDLEGVCKSVELHGAGSTEIVSGLHTIAARFDKAVLADGFKGYLQHIPSFATHLRRLAAGTKVYTTTRAHIASVEMRLPSVEEQQAIATVLSDMDAELAALEARRDKTRALKQAMMQELLTGRTRLAGFAAAGG